MLEKTISAQYMTLAIFSLAIKRNDFEHDKEDYKSAPLYFCVILRRGGVGAGGLEHNKKKKGKRKSAAESSTGKSMSEAVNGGEGGGGGSGGYGIHTVRLSPV